MKEVEKQTLSQAIQLIKKGKNEPAANILIPLLRQNPDIGIAWAIFFQATDSLHYKHKALNEILRLRPNDQWATTQMQTLPPLPVKPPPPPATPEPTLPPMPISEMPAISNPNPPTNNSSPQVTKPVSITPSIPQPEPFFDNNQARFEPQQPIIPEPEIQIDNSHAEFESLFLTGTDSLDDIENASALAEKNEIDWNPETLIKSKKGNRSAPPWLWKAVATLLLFVLLIGGVFGWRLVTTPTKAMEIEAITTTQAITNLLEQAEYKQLVNLSCEEWQNESAVFNIDILATQFGYKIPREQPVSLAFSIAELSRSEATIHVSGFFPEMGEINPAGIGVFTLKRENGIWKWCGAESGRVPSP